MCMNGEWQEEHHILSSGLHNPHFSCIHFYLLIKHVMNVAFSDPLDPPDV